jgi:hypothetical protein
MEASERFELLEEAEGLIFQAIENIETALRGTGQFNHANSYLIPHLKTWVGNGNPYDTSIRDYIESLEKEFNK